MNFDCGRKKFQEGFYGIKNFFLKHTEDSVLKPIIHINSFRRNCNFYVFDNSNQKYQIAEQPISVENMFFETGVSNVNGYTAFALVLTNRLVPIASDGKRQFDLL